MSLILLVTTPSIAKTFSVRPTIVFEIISTSAMTGGDALETRPFLMGGVGLGGERGVGGRSRGVRGVGVGGVGGVGVGGVGGVGVGVAIGVVAWVVVVVDMLELF
jgi:hypothetical protein